MKKTHLIGIGGVGMSALAQALLDAGHDEVSGSDRLLNNPSAELTPSLKALKEQGVKLYPDDGSGVTADTDRVVVSSAVEDANPGMVKAKSLALPVVHRAAALAECLFGRKLVAVAGTCGKSTVTAMLGHILAGAGFDPVVVNGAAVVGWDEQGARVGSVRRGRGVIAVAEVDESDKSLMSFLPDAAVITNASADHFGIEETQELFESFKAKVKGVCIDSRDATMPEFKQEAGISKFVLDGIEYSLPMPGAHNVSNAICAVKMALALGANPAAVKFALALFPGVERRLQRVGDLNGAAVIDDYAHNPAKLTAMWETLADAFPQGVAVVWRPHGFGPLCKMMDDLAAAFKRLVRPQDALFLLPVYYSGGTADHSVDSDVLAEKLRAEGVQVRLVADLVAAEVELRAIAGAVGAVVLAGARDPGLPVLAAKLANKSTEEGEQ